MANKIIKIAVKDIDGLKTGGEYELRYRIKSKDGTRKSEWSDITNLSYPLNDNGQVSSFYELYVSPYDRPNLSDGAGADPHPSNSYVVETVNPVITSSIVPPSDDSGIYTYSWGSVAEYPVTQKFDVYLSWKSGSTWLDWTFAGTTTSNNFSFKKPNSTYQYVQAAVFLSSYPKLTNIYGPLAETTFVSIANRISTYYSATGSVTSTGVTGAPPYRTTITGLSGLPSTKDISGRKVFATDNGGSLGVGSVTADSVSGTTLTVTSTTALTVGAVTDVRL